MEKATMQCAGSMWSLARCRGTGGRVKKKGSGPWPWQFGFLDGGAGQRRHLGTVNQYMKFNSMNNRLKKVSQLY